MPQLGSLEGLLDLHCRHSHAILLKQKLEGHDQAVKTLAFTPDGKRLASGAGDGTVILWSVGK